MKNYFATLTSGYFSTWNDFFTLIFSDTNAEDLVHAAHKKLKFKKTDRERDRQSLTSWYNFRRFQILDLDLPILKYK